MVLGRKKKILDLTMNKSAKKIILKNIDLRMKSKGRKNIIRF